MSKKNSGIIDESTHKNLLSIVEDLADDTRKLNDYMQPTSDYLSEEEDTIYQYPMISHEDIRPSIQRIFRLAEELKEYEEHQKPVPSPEENL